MTISITFDTLKFVKTLTEAGVPQNQAEAQAVAFKSAHEENLDCLATKQDLIELKQEIKHEINEIKYEINETKNEIDLKCSALKIDIIKWVLSIVFSVSAAQTAVIVTLLRVLH